MPDREGSQPEESEAISNVSRDGMPMRHSIQRLLVNLAAFVVIIAGMRAASSVLVLLLLSAFIAVIVTPVFLGMTQRGIPPFAAVLVLMLGLVLIGTLTANVVGNSLEGVADNLPSYQERMMEQTEGMRSWLKGHGMELPEGSIVEALRGPSGMRLVGNTITALSGFAGRAVIILLIAIFILLEASLLPAKFKRIPNLSEESVVQVRQVVINLRQYMAMKTLMSLLTGFLVGVMLFVLGVDYPILLGILAFALNYVPNIGSFVAGIPGTLLALVQYGFGMAVGVAAAYLVINVLVSNVIEPRFMGKGLGLSPMIILVSLIVWGWILGPIGMLLAVPLTMAFKIVLAGFDETRGISILMGGAVPEDEGLPGKRGA